jgi:integrase
MKPAIIKKERSSDGKPRFYLRFKIKGYPRREVAIKDVATLEQAWGAVAPFLPKIEQGIDPFIPDKPMREWFKEYKRKGIAGLKPSTAKNVEQIMGWFLAWLESDHPRVKSAKDVTPAIIKDRRRARLEAPRMIACASDDPAAIKVGKQWKKPHETDKVSARTWNLERAYLIGFFDYIEGELTDYENPVRKVDREKEEKKRRQRIREDHIAPLLAGLAEFYGERYSMCFELMIGCALRPNEACRLRPSHVDRFARVVWLTETKTREDNSVPIPRGLVDRLVSLTEAANHKEPLFPKLDAMGSALERTCKRLGIPRYSLYSGRHTGISRAADAGVSPYDLMRFARHKNVTTTMGYYHGNDDGKRAAADAADALNLPPKLSPIVPLARKKKGS